MFKKHLYSVMQIRSSLWILSGLRLVCHCGERQACHADSLIAACTEVFPAAYDGSDLGVPPLRQQLNFLVESDEGSSADEEAAARGDGQGSDALCKLKSGTLYVTIVMGNLSLHLGDGLWQQDAIQKHGKGRYDDGSGRTRTYASTSRRSLPF